MRVSRVVLLCAVAVLALALVAAVEVDAQAKGKAKVKAPAAKVGGAKDAKDGKQKARLPHIRTKRESPLKGVSPAPKPKGKQPTDRVSARKANTAGNAAMGAAAKADAPKAGARAQGGKSKVVAPPKQQQKQQPKQAKAKSAARLHKFRQQDVLQADADAAAGTAAQAVVYPARNPTNDGWLLTASTVIPDAMVDKIAAEMTPLPDEKTFYHWDSPQPCIRWARNGMSEGEIKWFDSNSAGMASGGGLYMSASLNSYSYGPFPCRVVIKKGTLQYDDSAVSRAFSKAKISAPSISQDAKVALGQIIPFIHMYSSSNGWWVTHHWTVFARFIGGTHDSPFEAGKQVVPHWDSGEWQSGNTHMGLWKLWNQMMNGAATTKSGKIEPESALNDLKGGLEWLKKFTYLFSYIDGPSLIRALSVSPNDPFNVFEKDMFPGYMALYERLVQTRLAEPSTTKSLFGVSRGGRFGSETAANADAWAQEVYTKTYPKLWSEIAGGKTFALRTGEVRAGGDEEGRTFIATPGQVQVLKKNLYLTVVDAPPRPDGTVLVYYYYPDPLHLPQTLKSRVTPAVWEQCLDVQRMATAPGADFEAVKKSPEYGKATQALIQDLLLELFKRIYNGDPRMVTTGLIAMMDLVSIHPNDDYNGRTTRMFGVVAAIESSYDPPIAFMSDFDLVTAQQNYGAFLNTASTAYLNLKLAMTSELMTAVCNSAQPNHYAVSAWATFAYDALKPFLPSSVTTVKFDSSDWDTIAHRRFIVLMDKISNSQWIGRAASGAVAPPAVQKPGDSLVLTPPPPKAAPAPTK